MNARKLLGLSIGTAVLSCSASAQVPDLLNSLDAGGRAMGAGGSFYGTGADTLSTFYNPAGIAFLTTPQFGAAYRNLPTSRTTISGDTNDPVFSSKGSAGGSQITHLGYVTPLGNGRAGILGISYTLGGFIDDVLTGSTTSGSVTTQKNLSRRARGDYYSLVWAQPRTDQSFSWGIGVQVVQEHLDYKLNQQDSNGGSIIRDSSSTGTGISGIIGLQFTPKANPNVTFGLSYRSEANLTGNSDTSDLLDKIPARLLGGVAFRQDGFRGNRDFVVYGAQIMHFFSADNGPDFDRSNQTVAGFGVEYNYNSGSFRVPLRVGYNVVPEGGNGFGSRNTFTFGLGYRPNNGRYSFDLNFANPQHGGYDIAFGLNYKLGK